MLFLVLACFKFLIEWLLYFWNREPEVSCKCWVEDFRVGEPRPGYSLRSGFNQFPVRVTRVYRPSGQSLPRYRILKSVGGWHGRQGLQSSSDQGFRDFRPPSVDIYTWSPTPFGSGPTQLTTGTSGLSEVPSQLSSMARFSPTAGLGHTYTSVHTTAISTLVQPHPQHCHITD